jgi:hypothetical protein
VLDIVGMGERFGEDHCWRISLYSPSDFVPSRHGCVYPRPCSVGETWLEPDRKGEFERGEHHVTCFSAFGNQLQSSSGEIDLSVNHNARSDQLRLQRGPGSRNRRDVGLQNGYGPRSPPPRVVLLDRVGMVGKTDRV